MKNILSFFVISIFLSGCSMLPSDAGIPAPETPPTGLNQMANPASVFCEENGGKIDIREDESSGQIGICVFPDGSECEEWKFLRGQCTPGAGKPDKPTDDKDSKITDFESCVEAGNPIMESYPRQCGTPDGDVFFEGPDAENPNKPDFTEPPLPEPIEDEPMGDPELNSG